MNKTQDPKPEQCRACFGRGYKPEPRRRSGRNPHGIGFYARTCPSCGGRGERVYIRKVRT